MRRCDVTDEAETGKITLAFTFDGHDARELAEIVGLVQAARSCARANARLELELAAHHAYFTVLERGTRGLPGIGFQADEPVQGSTQEPKP